MLGPLEEVLAKPDGGSLALSRGQIALAHRNGLRLLKLVNALLDFSRLEAGRGQARFEPVDLSQFVHELASNFRSAMDKAGLRLILDCPPLGEPIYVDRDMWEKVVLNLLSNAFKFTFEGEIAIAVRRAADGGFAEMVISDTGTGIPPQELPHLFERFRRVEGARGRSIEGSGIGLALVQELVKLHGGSISVASRFDAGSSFSVRVPMGKAHLPAAKIGAGSVSNHTHPVARLAQQALDVAAHVGIVEQRRGQAGARASLRRGGAWLAVGSAAGGAHRLGRGRPDSCASGRKRLRPAGAALLNSLAAIRARPG